MAKQEEERDPWKDFYADDDIINDEEELDEGVEEEEEQEEEEEEERPKPEKKKDKDKKKDVPKKDKAPKVEDQGEEEEEEKVEPEDSEEESEEKKEDEDVVDPSQFYDQVEKITGQEVEVDYGGVDPLTPQGVAIREQALKTSILDGFLEEIETKFPVAYRALQHAYNGGDVADLFKTTTNRDYSKVEIGDKDTALATEIMKEYYRNSGIKNEARILRMIEADEDSDLGLIGEARNALEELKNQQEARTNEILQKQQNQAAEQTKRDKVMITAIEEVLDTGKISNFKLPTKQEASDFKKFLVQNIRRLPEGKYEFSTPIEPSNLEKILQYQYFQFKKGDLGKLIEIKATTKTAENLRLKLKSEQERSKSGSTGASPITNKMGSMKDFEI